MKKFIAVFVFGLLLTACGAAPAEEPVKNTPPAASQAADGLTGFDRCINSGGKIIGEEPPRRCLLDSRMYMEKVAK